MQSLRLAGEYFNQNKMICKHPIAMISVLSISSVLGVVYLEMCDALMKIATQAATKMSNEDISSSINMIPIPVLCERAKGYLANANQLLEHEDPDGPESGGLIAGARQLELSLAQFQ